MKLAVSYDEHGNILTLFDTAQLHGETWTLAYVPAEGENHRVFDVPEKLEDTPIKKLHEVLHVNLSEAHPRLEPKS
jgi:hypothetical protein